MNAAVSVGGLFRLSEGLPDCLAQIAPPVLCGLIVFWLRREWVPSATQSTGHYGAPPGDAEISGASPWALQQFPTFSVRLILYSGLGLWQCALSIARTVGRMMRDEGKRHRFVLVRVL